MSGDSEVSRRTANLDTHVPALVAAMPGEPNIAPYFFVDMSYKELHTLRKKRGFPDRDVRPLLLARPLAMDQIERKRARDNREDEPP